VGSILKKACFIGWVCLFLFGPGTSSEAVVDRVVAVVNQEIITLSELEKWKEPFLAEIKAEDRLERREQTHGALRKLLDHLVEEKLIDQEVKKIGLKLTGKELEAAVEEIKRKNGMAQEEFEKALAVEGVNLEGFKKEIEKQILRMKVVGLLMKTETKAGEKELREFYQKTRDRYRGTETYRPAHILFYVPKEATPEDIREIRKKCQKVLEKIQKGEDFGEMAVLYSEDASAKDRGDLGFFKKGDLIPAIETQALRLKVGEISGIVRTDFGFHIIKLLERRGGDAPPFEEVRDRVEAEYNQTQTERLFRQVITTLKEKAVIEIKL
jgi:peptidyl-prolyl cis-trans isomerase SurA